MSFLTETHDPLPDCDCQACVIHERDHLRIHANLLRDEALVERESIVSWLRGHPDGEPLGVFCDALADWIEKGQHHA